METKLPTSIENYGMESRTRTVLCLITSIIFFLPATVFAKNYYLDCSAGANGDGSPASPWNNVASVNNHAPFAAGDTIFVKRGTTCLGELWPKGSGNSTAQIVLCTYGPDSAKPIIDARGAANSAAIKLSNQEYWTIDGFEVTNNATTYGTRYGIHISAADGQVKRRFRILNNTIRNVYATALREPANGPSFYTVGGIYVKVHEPGRMDDVLIEGNRLHRIVAIGICFWGESEMVGGGMNWNNLSTNVVVRRNTVDSTAADGILILGTDNELVEYNTVGYAGALGVRGTDYIAGMWPTRHRDGLWQYNEVHHTKKFIDDGQGFDNDMYLSGTTIFQYNYSHHNEGGFFLDCWDEDNPDKGKSILRYNISVNEVGGRNDRGNAEFTTMFSTVPGW